MSDLALRAALLNRLHDERAALERRLLDDASLLGAVALHELKVRLAWVVKRINRLERRFQ